MHVRLACLTPGACWSDVSLRQVSTDLVR